MLEIPPRVFSCIDIALKYFLWKKFLNVYEKNITPDLEQRLKMPQLIFLGTVPKSRTEFEKLK